jgi:hypothetical protein
MKQPHWRTRLQMVALLVNPANFFHAAAASQIAFEAIAQAHYGAVFVVANALLVLEAAQIAKLSLKYQPTCEWLTEGRGRAPITSLCSNGKIALQVVVYKIGRRGGSYTLQGLPCMSGGNRANVAGPLTGTGPGPMFTGAPFLSKRRG